jgi:hypothetical protein
MRAQRPPRSPLRPLGDGRLTGALPRNIREQQGANLGLPIAPVSPQGSDRGQFPSVCPACYGFSINMEHRGDLRWREQLLGLWCACGHCAASPPIPGVAPPERQSNRGAARAKVETKERLGARRSGPRPPVPDGDTGKLPEPMWDATSETELTVEAVLADVAAARRS